MGFNNEHYKKHLKTGTTYFLKATTLLIFCLFFILTIAFNAPTNPITSFNDADPEKTDPTPSFTLTSFGNAAYTGGVAGAIAGAVFGPGATAGGVVGAIGAMLGGAATYVVGGNDFADPATLVNESILD